MINVAPSILSADFSDLDREIFKMVEAGAPFIHFDVMDGIFVPNKTFGPEVVGMAPRNVGYVKDTHLMVVDPKNWIEPFAKAGSDIITFHIEATNGLEESKNIIDFIHSLGVKAGISIKPKTDPGVIIPLLPYLDLVLVMSVEPGFGGQGFMEIALDKIAFLRREIDKVGKKTYLEVDGGINQKTGALCVKKGADTLVAGSYLYGHDDYVIRLKGLAKL